MKLNFVSAYIHQPAAQSVARCSNHERPGSNPANTGDFFIYLFSLNISIDWDRNPDRQIARLAFFEEIFWFGTIFFQI